LKSAVKKKRTSASVRFWKKGGKHIEKLTSREEKSLWKSVITIKEKGENAPRSRFRPSKQRAVSQKEVNLIEREGQHQKTEKEKGKYSPSKVQSEKGGERSLLSTALNGRKTGLEKEEKA